MWGLGECNPLERYMQYLCKRQNVEEVKMQRKDVEIASFHFFSPEFSFFGPRCCKSFEAFQSNVRGKGNKKNFYVCNFLFENLSPLVNLSLYASAFDFTTLCFPART